MELSTAKALDTQQRKLLGSVRGLSGMMRLAARAAEGLNRSMSAYDAQAPERLNKSVERMERAVQRLVDPMTEAASSLADMNAAIREASGRLAGMTKHMSAMQLTARASAAASVSGSSPALAAAVGSDKQDQKKQIEDKVKKEVLPAFARVGEMLTSAIPIFELNQKVEQASGEKKLSEQQEKSEKQAAGEETARMQVSKAVETASKVMAAAEKSTQENGEKESGSRLVKAAEMVDKALGEFKAKEQAKPAANKDVDPGGPLAKLAAEASKSAALAEKAKPAVTSDVDPGGPLARAVAEASKSAALAEKAKPVVTSEADPGGPLARLAAEASKSAALAEKAKPAVTSEADSGGLLARAVASLEKAEQTKQASKRDVDPGGPLAKAVETANKAVALAEKTEQVKQTSKNNADPGGPLARAVEVAAKAMSEQEKAQQRKQTEMSVKSTEQQVSREAIANNALTANNAAGSAVPTPGAMNNSGQSVPNVAPMPNLKDQVAGLNQAFSAFMTQNSAVSAFVVDNWGAFEHVYKGVNAAISAYNTLQLISRAYTVLVTVAQQGQRLATLGLKNAWSAMNATMKANVFILIASAIVGIVMALISLWKTNDQFAAFFIRIWHWILGFVDQIPIFFLGMVEGVLIVFKKFSEIISKFLGGLFKKFDPLIKIYNELFDKDLKLPSPESIEDWADGKLQVVRALKVGMEGVAAKKAADREADLAKFLKDREDARNKEEEVAQPLNAVNPVIAQTESVVVGGGRLDEVGRVNDTVEINSEDLKTMRELAELKNIQNFVTLTPSVNVQTGDIRNGMDVSSMVQAITVALQEEIAASAEGVYA
ncbi:putative phage tail tape measure protein [Paenibacillus agaridevorans]|uniref:Putative phage tail tape measure protein n=1 Tax=Paenibacillus agaridevorans TaxID=171404 RepID=A0A2R5F1I6_9BACL|nr:hypothetical protein [Paenibacillus agaridevorans]GBG11338.1 putative phage tail tape measure protein [Paenibacillus agaridevorans]